MKAVWFWFLCLILFVLFKRNEPKPVIPTSFFNQTVAGAELCISEGISLAASFMVHLVHKNLEYDYFMGEGIALSSPSLFPVAPLLTVSSFFKSEVTQPANASMPVFH